MTHFFNAMSPLHRRDPGLLGAAFSSDRAVCGIIADGRHVHPEMVRLAYRLLGPERLYLTTDAISAAGAGPGEFTLAGRPTSISGGLPRLASGEMSGSLRTMDEAFRNILSFTGCTVAEAAKMAATTAADLIGTGDRKGRLAPGYDADVVALSPDLEVEAVWKVRRANEPVALPQALKKAPTMAEARMAAQPMPVSVEEPARRLTSTSNTPSTSNILATGLSDRMPLFAPLFIPLLT